MALKEHTAETHITLPDSDGEISCSSCPTDSCPSDISVL